MQVTRESLAEFLIQRFDLRDGQLHQDTALFSDGLLDSFHMVELIRYLEQEEKVRISVMEVTLENLDSIDRILRFVASKRGKS